MGALSEHGLEAARPSAPVEGLESKIEFEIKPTTATTVASNIQVHDFNRTILQGPNLPENVIIKGSGSVGTTGAVGAVDRITHEILLSLDERPTLVAWLFDQSGSLKPQRESIAKRFDRVYKELGIIEKSGNNAFKQHGQTAAADGRRASSAIRSTCSRPNRPTTSQRSKRPCDRSSDDPKDNGRENVFQSVGFLAEKFRHHRLGDAAPERDDRRVHR